MDLFSKAINRCSIRTLLPLVYDEAFPARPESFQHATTRQLNDGFNPRVAYGRI